MARKIVAILHDPNLATQVLADLRNTGIAKDNLRIASKDQTVSSRHIAKEPVLSTDKLNQLFSEMELSGQDCSDFRKEFENNRILILIDPDQSQTNQIHTVLQKHGLIRETSGAAQSQRPQVPSDLRRLESNYLELSGGRRDPSGWNVYGSDREKIGEIKYLIGSPEQSKVHLVIVDAGGFFTNKLVAFPVSYLTFSPDEEKAFVPFTKDQVKDSPAYEESGDFIPYFDYWSNVSQREETFAGKK